MRRPGSGRFGHGSATVLFVMSGARQRLDLELVRRGLAPSRHYAQSAIEEGRVLVGGAIAERSARLVARGEPIQVLNAGPQFVGRGGEKLRAALERFEIVTDGATVLDAGSSTGGFTDCVLQQGAVRVFAVDVGYGQLDARLRSDVRVVVMERTNVRALTLELLTAAGGAPSPPVDLVTADLAFISLTTVIPVLAGPIIRKGGDLVLLVKPQFEVGRVDVSRGKGVIRDPALWRGALVGVASSLDAMTAAIMGAMRSPITGASGNTEFLVHAIAHVGRTAPETVAEFFDLAVAEA